MDISKEWNKLTKDNYPAGGVPCILTDRWGDLRFGAYFPEHKKWKVEYWVYDDEDIKAWMYAPEPYKEEK